MTVSYIFAGGYITALPLEQLRSLWHLEPVEAVEAEPVASGVPHEEASCLVFRGVSDLAHPRKEKCVDSGETLCRQVWSHSHLIMIACGKLKLFY